MIPHSLFPILLTEHSYDDHARFKEIFMKKVYQHFADHNSETDSGYRVGCQEQYDLHLVPEFKPLYTFLQKCVEEYLQQLYIDMGAVKVYTSKSWLNIIKESRIPYHGHGDAHLSAVYYVNIPEDSFVPLRFHNYFERMEPYPGCVRYNNKADMWNDFNAYTWSFVPYEGAAIVFPGRLMHDSEDGLDNELMAIPTFDDFKGFRVSMAADYIITLNSHQGKAMGLQPVEQWRDFSA